MLSLSAMDPTFTRATSGLECDAAIALLMQGERSEARRHLARAMQLARQTGSARQRRRIELTARAA